MKNPVVEQEIDNLSDYLTLIVEPTFLEYQRNPHSARQAFLTCVAISTLLIGFPTLSLPVICEKNGANSPLNF